jgi:hypothetical protein
MVIRMTSVSPVLTDREIEVEQVIALDQPDYYPIIVARIRYADSSPASVTRFRFSDEEREAIANGADLLISQPHHGDLMPIGLQLAMKDSYPISEAA